MNRKQTNHQNMHLAVVKLLDDNKTIIDTEPLVADEYSLFKAIVAKITATNEQKQNTDTGGYTKNKNKALDNAFTIAAAISVKAKPYARKIKDDVLLKAIDHSFTDLHELADDKGLTICKAMITALEPHLVALQPYKVTQATLTELSNAITTATPKAAERDIVDATHINSNAQLVDLFKQAKASLIELDDLMEGQLSDTHKDLVDTYFIARRIIDLRGGGGSRAEEVKK